MSPHPPLHLTASGAVRAALASPGLRLDLGLAALHLRSRSALLAGQLQSVYPHFPFEPPGDFADLHVHVDPGAGLRRWIRPQARFRCDSRRNFEPFPASHALPLVEWGSNWLIGQRFNDHLLLHAGAVERDGRALLLPAVPGSGKSTLTAALSLSGWRLLSDEFGAIDPASGEVRPVLKPVALKNRSIDVIRAFAPDAPLGPAFPNTRKGTVAHLAASAAAVAARHRGARPAAVILPRWSDGAALSLQPVPPEELLPAVGFNAFNYRVLGARSFDAAVRLVRQCPGWRLTYSRLDDALRGIDQLWRDLVPAA